MKISTLLPLTVALVAFAAAGCKQTPVRTTVLPGHTPAGAGMSAAPAPELNTPPVATGERTGEITSTPVAPETLKADLPDDSGLAGRDQDRKTFANETVYFEYDQAVVRGSEASKLEQVAGAFRAKGKGFDLLIEGHCDERGTEEYNRALGERRALAIRELLIKSGVDGAHVFTRSFGKDQPAVAGHDEAAWSKNRRGEFILVLPRQIITTQNTK